MNVYLSIDDTDNLDSPGSGQLSEVLSKELQDLGLASECSNITRHQLFVHETIPFTSHNSSMCFTANIAQCNLADAIRFTRQFLKKASAPGSDPGLCVATTENPSSREILIDFGLRAKRTVLTKKEAYFIAEKAGVHLSEHGGTGDGVVGALAGTGLRFHGSDGRFRGWLTVGVAGQITHPQELCSHPCIDGVVDDTGTVLPNDAKITLTEAKIKTVFFNHCQIVPVARVDNSGVPAWTTLTRSEVKRF